MRFSKAITFDASPERVFAVLTDEAFRAEVAAEAGAESSTIEVVDRGDGRVEATVDSTQATDELPGVAKKFLGATFTIHQVENWSSPLLADLSVTIPGAPVKVAGTVTLRAVGEQTEQLVEADVKVSVPLIGGKVEKMIGSILGNILKLQGRHGNEWLSR